MARLAGRSRRWPLSRRSSSQLSADFSNASSARLIGAGLTSESDAEPVPTIDCDRHHREVHQLTLAEMSACVLISLIRNMIVRDARQRLDPAQRRTFTLSIE